MSAISLGFDAVEDRLRFLRRRHNRTALAQAIYRSLGTLFLVLSALVLAGLGFGSREFLLVVYAAIAIVVSVAALSALRLRKAWMTTMDAARYADRAGQLDDRLTTLVASQRSGPPSRLRPVLLTQVLVSARGGKVDGALPHRPAPALYFFLFSLCALAATPFLAPSVADPAPQDLAGLPPGSTVHPTTGQRQVRGHVSRALRTALDAHGMGDGATAAGSAHRTDERDLARRRIDAEAASTAATSLDGGRKAPGDNGPGALTAGHRVQRFLREAFAAPPSATGGPQKSAVAGQASDPSRGTGRLMPEGERKRIGSPAPAADRPDGKGAPAPREAGPQAGGQHEAGAPEGRGDSSAGSRGSLFASPATGEPPRAAQPLALNLRATSTRALAPAEPSHTSTQPGSASGAGNSAAWPGQPSSGAAGPDAALLRPAVPPGHERTLERIFEPPQ